jgi:hypothetical protein
MRVRNLNIGVESITLWQRDDEVHLPNDGALKPQFLPLYQHLDEILKRPSLDERLPNLLQPEFLDPDLLEPRTLTDTRESTRETFARLAKRQTGRARRLFEMVSAQLDEDGDMDEDIRRSLAQLMRG